MSCVPFLWVHANKCVLPKTRRFVVYLLGVSVTCAAAPGTYTERGSLGNDEGQRKACRFSKSLLGSCSGDGDSTFGFSKGKPCIIVKLNRIVNYRPKVGLSWVLLSLRDKCPPDCGLCICLDLMSLEGRIICGYKTSMLSKSFNILEEQVLSMFEFISYFCHNNYVNKGFVLCL